jgi:hypothetical protein
VPLGAWCTSHKDTIAAVGDIVAAAGFLATGAGLGLTVIQLRTTRGTLQAASAYQIQKDAHELAGKLSDESVDAPGAASIRIGDSIWANTRRINLANTISRPRLGSRMAGLGGGAPGRLWLMYFFEKES